MNTFTHPEHGQVTIQDELLAIRWARGVAESEQDRLLKGPGLKIAEAAQGSRFRANNSAGLTWVRAAVSVLESAARELLRSPAVRWVAPAMRAPNASPEELFTINPTAAYVRDIGTIREQAAALTVHGATLEYQKAPSLRGYIDLAIALDKRAPQLERVLAVVTALRTMGATNKGDILLENIPFFSPTCGPVVPNDPSFAAQWNAWRISAPYAWTRCMGNAGISVAVIDQGVELAHPDLLLDPQSWNASDDLPDGGPVGSHGTACAGIVAARIGNAAGVAGIGGGCRVMALATSTWADVDIAENLYFAADNGARVVSMSFGVYPTWGWSYAVVEAALQYAIDRGLVLVAASGNENQAIARFPGTDPRTICVGGTNRDDLRKTPGDVSGEFWGACYGPSLEVCAPCHHIPTTDILGAGGYDPGDYYMRFNGTSSATPHVAGLAGLMLSAAPKLTGAAVRQIIEATCDKVRTDVYAYALDPTKPNGTWNNDVGYGRINAERALVVALESAPSDVSTQSVAGGTRWTRHAHVKDTFALERSGLVPALRQTALVASRVRTPTAVLFDGTSIWATNSTDHLVHKLDAMSGRVMVGAPVAQAPRCMTFDGWQVCVGGGVVEDWRVTLVAIDTLFTRSVVISGEPRAMAFDGNHVWVACPTRLHKIDTRVGAIVLTVTFPKASLRGLCFDGARLWLSGSNGGWGCIWTIDVNWGFSIAAVPPSFVGQFGSMAFDGSSMWAARVDTPDIYTIDAATFQIKGNLTLPDRVSDMIFDGTHVWAADRGVNRIVKFDPQKPASIVRQVGCASRPASLTFDGAHLWVASTEVSEISRIAALPLGLEQRSAAFD